MQCRTIDVPRLFVVYLNILGAIFDFILNSLQKYRKILARIFFITSIHNIFYLKSLHHIDTTPIMIKIKMAHDEIINRMVKRTHHSPKSFKNSIINSTVNKHLCSIRPLQQARITLSNVEESYFYF